MDATTNTNKVLIWDWPIRIFHWAFALCVGGALLLALLAEAGSRLFIWHMLLGIAACFLLLVRIFLGLFGSRHNRFRAMLFTPVTTVRYCWSIITFKPLPHVAHNPGAALAALLMYLAVALLLWTGLKAEGEAARQAHVALAYVLLGAAVAHLVGITANAIHSRGEAAFSMLTGRRTGPVDAGLVSSRPMVALVLLALTGLWLGGLFASFDAAKGTVKLPLLDCTLPLEKVESVTPTAK